MKSTYMEISAKKKLDVVMMEEVVKMELAIFCCHSEAMEALTGEIHFTSVELCVLTVLYYVKPF